jgi:hypothetical protein
VACAKSIAGSEQSLFALVPDYEGELSVKIIQTGCAVPLIQMNQDFAISSCSESMPKAFEFLADLFKTIKLTVNHRDDCAIFVKDRLRS